VSYLNFFPAFTKLIFIFSISVKTKYTPECDDDSQSSTSHDMNKRLKMGEDEDEEEGSFPLYETLVKYRNPPVQMSVYKDSKTGLKKVMAFSIGRVDSQILVNPSKNVFHW